MSNPKGASSHWLLRLILVAVVLVAAGFGVNYAMRPLAQVMPAVPGKAVNAVPASVEVKAEFAIELKSEVSGRVSASTLEIGRSVAKDDVLVQLDSGDVELEIERIKNEITAARKRVELGSTLRPEVLNARDTLDNYERQTKAGLYPAAEFDKQRRLYQQLQQRMELDEVNTQLALANFENSLHAKEREKSKMTIVVPSDGIVTSVVARVGDLIGSNSPIATVIATGRTVEAKVSEENFSGIRVGQKASVRFLGYGAQLYGASVTKVLPTADPETQRYIIHLHVDMPVEKQVPGLTGEATIVIGERTAAAIVPRRAVRGNEVLVVVNGTVEMRKVQVGYVALNQVEVLAGLREGESVIVEELDRFQPGDRVRAKPVN